MTLSELVFTVRGREHIGRFDAALLEDAEQAVPAVLVDGVMMDGTADTVFTIAHELAVKHDPHLHEADAQLHQLKDALKHGTAQGHHDISGMACDGWTPEILAAYYLSLAVGHQLAARLSE